MKIMDMPCRLGLVMVLLLNVLSVDAQYDDTNALSERIASYTMDIHLDIEAKQVNARQILTFKNPSADTIWNMRFHMYYNAWKNNKTDFFVESGRIPRTKAADEIEQCVWSWVEVTKIIDEVGNDLSSQMSYVQPDDDNIHDHTVLDVQLTTPILPGQTYRLHMDWQSQIPPLMIRTGYERDYYFMAQWYPKLGVYEMSGQRFAEAGQWNCHQYHPSTEYYGEFGVYDVSLTVPKSHVVGASGRLIEKHEDGDMMTHRYLAEDVIDFTWTSHPGFVEILEQWRDTEIRLLIRPEHLCNQERFLGAARHTLDYFADYLEPYPYPTLTIVSPPYYGLNSGAMEYPTLITAPTLCNLPEGIKTTETLVIHEVTHQYFMQMLATNEQEEPWMDEGFTAFFEARILDTYYPEGTVSWPYMGINVSSEELRRGRFFNAENIKINPLSDYGWHFKHGSYAQIVYGKGAVVLRTLEGLIGEEVMKKVMRTYFTRWKFKHPGRQDFIDIANEVVKKMLPQRFPHGMDWFFEQAIYGTDVCDYTVRSVVNTLVTPAYGFLENTTDCVSVADEVDEYLSKVTVFRLGEFTLPQEILVNFDNGDYELVRWNGEARSHELVYRGPRQVMSVEIDPYGKIPLDCNLINNSYIVEPDRTGVRRLFVSLITWLQSTMTTLSAWI